MLAALPSKAPTPSCSCLPATTIASPWLPSSAAEEAARAFDRETLRHTGRGAITNFPLSGQSALHSSAAHHSTQPLACPPTGLPACGPACQPASQPARPPARLPARSPTCQPISCKSFSRCVLPCAGVRCRAPTKLATCQLAAFRLLFALPHWFACCPPAVQTTCKKGRLLGQRAWAHLPSRHPHPWLATPAAATFCSPASSWLSSSCRRGSGRVRCRWREALPAAQGAPPCCTRPSLRGSSTTASVAGWRILPQSRNCLACCHRAWQQGCLACR
jgi:hypothetical protein